MYLNTGYLNHSHMDFKDKSRPLIVGSCGTYRLSRHPKLPTYRPRGRLDYQIIYITAGCGHFHFDNVNNETIVPAGNIVLYRPKELQKYEYYGEDKTEVYWIHFTGSNVKNILRQYGFPDKERVFQVGTSNEYEQIFKRIIIELQRCQDNYEEMLVLLLRHLLISFHRELTREHILKMNILIMRWIMLLPFSVKTTIKISILMIMLPHEARVSAGLSEISKIYRFYTNAIHCGNPHQQCSDVT